MLTPPPPRVQFHLINSHTIFCDTHHITVLSSTPRPYLDLSHLKVLYVGIRTVILRMNCLIKHIIEGKKTVRRVKGKQGRRRKQLLYDFKETTRYWK
jgi:hypothetical protein